MAAYVIADIEVKDLEEFQKYSKQVPPTLAKYGGRFIVRGGAHEVLEGGWRPRRLVIVEFPDMAALKAWYNSKEYGPLVKLRQKASDGNLVAVDGG